MTSSLPAAVLSVLLLLAPSPARAAPVPDRSVGVGGVPVEATALAVLHAWDDRRAAAWARGDVDLLRRLYVAGSRTGRADVAMLRAYADRGLRVTGLRTQVLAVAVRSRAPARMVLRVTDRLAGGVVRGGGRPLALPADRPTARVVALRRVDGRWRVVEVGTGVG